MTELRFLKRTAVRLSPDDNVGVALVNLHPGENVELSGLLFPLTTHVPSKHKFALKDFAPGDEILMYGVVVGQAVQPISEGTALSTSNVKNSSARILKERDASTWHPPVISRWHNVTFDGYRRADGEVGTRNYWLVVPLVFCENQNLLALKHAFDGAIQVSKPDAYQRHVADLVSLYKSGRADEIASYPFPNYPPEEKSQKIFPNIDGIRFLTHTLGCGGTREDARSLCGLLAGYVHHPNVAGATILSLGCQNAQVSVLQEEIRKRDPHFEKPVFIFDQQNSNLETLMLKDAIRATFQGLVHADKCTRSSAALSSLTVGLKCGGSDGFSGISANPAIGHTSDLLAAIGAKCILAEFPELGGVEQNIVDRCVSSESAEKFVHLMSAYSARAAAIGSGFEMNPSPGNIRDGLITHGMKSAGAARKGGTSPITDVLDYPEYATKAGLNLLCTPGNDVEAVSAQVGSGANVILFTTGLGTPTGNPIAPVLKISTSTELAERMSDIIDIDAGPIVRGEKTVQQVGEIILERIVSTASGKALTKAESKNQEDFIPWKRGVSL